MKNEPIARFNADRIREYCGLTGDDNPFHREEFMHNLPDKRGQVTKKQVAVPGLMILSSLGVMFGEDLTERVNRLDVYFGSGLGEEEDVKLVVSPNEEGARLEAFCEGKDALTILGEEGNSIHSRAYFDELEGKDKDSFALGEDSRSLNFLVTRESDVPKDITLGKRDKFGEVMGFSDTGTRNFFFGLSLVSRILFDAVLNPLRGIEKKLNQLYTLEGRLPVYNSLRVYSPAIRTSHIGEGVLEFDLSGKQGLKKSYGFVVRCKQGGNLIYSGEFWFRMTKREALTAGAKDSTIIAVA